MNQDDFINEQCDFCGLANWQHLERVTPTGKDLLPCEPMLKDYIGDARYDQHADENGDCRKCGKPLRDHLVYERISVKVMGTAIWDPSEINFALPKAEIPCHLVIPGDPLMGRVSQPPSRS